MKTTNLSESLTLLDKKKKTLKGAKEFFFVVVARVEKGCHTTSMTRVSGNMSVQMRKRGCFIEMNKFISVQPSFIGSK